MGGTHYGSAERQGRGAWIGIGSRVEGVSEVEAEADGDDGACVFG